MKYTKRFLALFLALCMMLTSVPLNVNATEGTPSEVATEAPAQDDDQTVTEEETSETVDSENTESTEKDEEDSETVTSDEDVVIGADQSDSTTDKDSQDTTSDDAKPEKDKPDNAKPGKDKKEDLKPGKDEKEDVKPGKDKKENVKPEKDKKTKEEDAQESVTMTSVPERSTEDTLSAALAEAKIYIDALTINNASNDPAAVVSNYGKHFTWDNEKRESSKTYLYDWSYYNGVVFEGLEYVYDETEEEVYGDYVEEYMSSLIASNGTWAKCTNNSSKECAGYNSTHGADCYKTASLLLDIYERTKDSRYLTIATTLYTDLDNAAKTYLLKNAGYNYRHTWASDPSPDLWLDGLYMILPFRAEYAKHINDTEELDLIVDRMQWVSNHMYNESKGLFYHAADSATSNSGTYWLRSIGWYAAAIADVMDSMEGENLEAMKAQLVKLVDGMKACQNAGNGMWLNNMDAGQSDKNPYETSGTALMSYAVMKAVNEGWLNESYADMAILAFKGICEEKLNNNNLTDICFKGTPGSSNSDFSYANEGKGVGPFIMLYAEVLEYVNDLAEEKPETPDVEEPSDQEVTVENTTIKVGNVTNLVAEAVKEEDKAVIVAKEYTNFVAFDVSATLAEGSKAMISIPVPAEWNATEDELVGISVEDGEVKEIKGTLSEAGIYSFEVDHFSAKGVAYQAAPVAEEAVYSGKGNLVGETVYTLDTDGVDTGSDYLIVNTNSGIGYALTNNNGSANRTQVTISNNEITVEDDSKIAWQFGGNATSATVGNNGSYLYPNQNSLSLSATGSNLTINKQDNGAYRIYRDGSSDFYLRYTKNRWTASTTSNTSSNVYLYKKSSNPGPDVVFEVENNTYTLFANGTLDLGVTVTVAGTQVNLSDCTIAWASVDENAATVQNGVVTGIADGTTYITATLSAVDGKALQNDITLRIPVTVANKTVTSAVLTGNDKPVTTRLNVAPDFSNIKLAVTYDDGTKATITTENGLVIEGYDITKIGYTYASIVYNGKNYGDVRVTVEGNPYEGLDDATEYPEYPADGAVRIDKTAKEIDFENTGVVQVELDVAGISVKPGIDAVLTIDISNSMAWKTGTKEYTAGEVNKLDETMDAVKAFAKILLADNEDGTATNNTITIVTFAGYDAEHWNGSGSYVDSVRTLVSKTNDMAVINAIADRTKFTAAEALDIAYIPAKENQNSVNNIKIDSGANRGDTNYDYAFWQTNQAITNGSLGGNDREIHVVFMTDGCASNFNNTYYRSNNVGYYYQPGTNKAYTYYAASSGEDWTNRIMNNLIANNGGNIYAKEVYKNVSGMYAIGFDMANGSFAGIKNWEENINWEETFNEIVSKVVTDDGGNGLIPVTAASESGKLKEFYESLATELRYAGTNANVSDTVDERFTLQLTQSTGTVDATVHGNLEFKPTIEVTAYELWSKNETDDVAKIGTRKTNDDGSYVKTVMEQVTFNDEGTEAYSALVGNGETNILAVAEDGTVTITAHYFTYTKTPEGEETFDWGLGNITDQEVALSFYAYLKGSLEGERPKGLYYTNEEAVLEYVDINGYHATQIFPIPAVAWGGASTAYEFYLVNDAGQPCDRNGNEIPFANRIIITGPYYEELYLNQEDEEIAKEIVAAYVLPAGYTLYDETAKYSVVTASGNIKGSLTISEPATGKEQTTILVSATEPSYIQSRVAFGVRYNMIPTEAEYELMPNKVVIDYGKSIIIDIASNNANTEPDYIPSLVGFSRYYDNVNLKTKFTNTSAVASYDAAYGTFSIEDAATGKVKYTPTDFVDSVENIFCVIKFQKDSDVYYMVDKLTVIPATSVYYETDFANNIFAVATTGTAWDTSKTVEADTTTADSIQDDGTIGKNQTYGFDSSYENDAYLSNKTSYYVEGQGYNSDKTPKTYTTFSFKGTGFEVLSRTGAAQGLIKVEVFSDVDMTKSEKTISVLNKSESNLELYQIPVVSVNDLSYGEHYVRISVDAAYTNNTGISALDSLNRGNQFFFDAVRVFEPAYGDSVAEAAYAADGEANRQLSEVRSLLLTQEAFEAIETNTDGMVFIDRGQDNILKVATYATIGPNNETYLSNGQAVAFGVNASAVPTSFDIGAKSITGAAADLKATITNNAGTSMETTREIASSTAQNINLLADADQINTIFASDKVYVVVTNTGDGVLSITDIKVAFDGTFARTVEDGIAPASEDDGIALASEFSDPYEVFYSVDTATFALARTILTAAEDEGENVPEEEQPEEEVPEEQPNYDILSASISVTGTKKNQKTIIIAETTQQVETVKVTEGRKDVKTSSVEYKDSEDGTRMWTITLSKTSNGKKTYQVTGYGEDGTNGSSVKVTLSRKK